MCPLTIGFVSVSGGTGNDVVARLYKTENGTDFFRVRLPLGRGLYYTWPVLALKGSQVAYVDAGVGDSSFLLKTVDGGGDSLGFWQALTVAGSYD